MTFAPRSLAAEIPASRQYLFCAVYLLCLGTRTRHQLGCGVALGAACWTWQPAAVIAIGSLSGWAVVRLLEEGHNPLGDLVHGSLRALLGAIAFSLVTIGALLAQGSLFAFTTQAIQFSVGDVGSITNDPYSLVMLLPMPVMVVGGAGLLAFVASPALHFRRADRPDRPDRRAKLPAQARQIRGAVFGWLVAYGALLSVELDYRGDTVPLLLPLGVLGGALMSRVGELAAGWGRVALAALLTFWLAGGDLLLPVHHSRHPYNPGQQIRRGAAPDALDAARGRGVLIFADVLLAQKVGENPKHPYVYWEPYTLEYIEEHEAGGVDGFLDRLIAKRYGAVTVGPRAGNLIPHLLPKLRGLYEPRKPFRSNAHSFVLRQR